MGIEYPVILDNNYATWNAYNNHYWPTLYLIDIDGCIIYTHIGEGAYTETEQTIQALLRERSSTIGTVSTTIGIPSNQIQTIELYYKAKPHSEGEWGRRRGRN